MKGAKVMDLLNLFTGAMTSQSTVNTLSENLLKSLQFLLDTAVFFDILWKKHSIKCNFKEEFFNGSQRYITGI
jgi:hypothetical protein